MIHHNIGHPNADVIHEWSLSKYLVIILNALNVSFLLQTEQVATVKTEFMRDRSLISNSNSRNGLQFCLEESTLNFLINEQTGINKYLAWIFFKIQYILILE